MKKHIGLVLASAVLLSALSGCSYAGVGVTGDKAVVARNDNFLFGILRKTFVCKVTDGGLSSCQTADSP
jgi:hypothetical protein